MKSVGIICAALLSMLWVGCVTSSTTPAQQISYLTFDSNSNPQVFTLSADGKTSTKMNVNLPQGAFFAAASPDATQVAFCLSDVNDQTAIYTVDLKGAQKKLTSGGNFGDCMPSFSPDGKFITFESYRDDPNFAQIYVMNSDGSNLKRILTDTTDNFFPQLSPDNKTVAFFRYNSGVSGTKPMPSFRQQWRAMQTNHAGGPHAMYAARPAAISSGDGLYTVDIDGSNPTEVLDFSNGYAATVVFTNDGKKIVFTTDQFAGDMEIAIVNLDGTGLVNLSNSASTPDYAPLIFGDKILFNRNNTDGYSDIYQMDVNGANQKNLTSTPAADEFLPGYVGLLS